jgi:glycerol-3-phosphate dehydrogenase
MAEEGVDVLVVGGGITGAGVALDAAARGYTVALVEKGDFSSGTSSKSTKLVHGGIRYLSQFDFGLTRESLVERGLLIRNAPFLVRPVGFILPLYKGLKRPMSMPFTLPYGFGTGVVLQAGLLMYDMLAGKLGIRRHRRIGRDTISILAPCVKTEGLTDAFIYYDAQTDDSRLTATVVRTAALHGALVANYVEVVGFAFRDGKIEAAMVRDRLGGVELTVKARTVVNAAGVFADRIEEMAGAPGVSIQPAKGVHLTVSREALRMDRHAIVLPETEDGRLLFLVPWGSRVAIGTTDTAGGDIDNPLADDNDIDYILRHVNRYMNCRLERGDVISAWAGYRPLVRPHRGNRESARLSRSHVVLDGPGGMVTIVGGKLTTYRRMAQDALNHIARLHDAKPSNPTEHLPLDGTEGWGEARKTLWLEGSSLRLSKDVLRHLATYGTNSRAILDLVRKNPRLGTRVVADLPYIMAEVVYACRHEMAVTLADVLERRTRISLEDRQAGAGAAEAVARCMAAELGWDDPEIERQISAYLEQAGERSTGYCLQQSLQEASMQRRFAQTSEPHRVGRQVPTDMR